MNETKVQIGEDVLLDIDVHSDWYISSIGYDGKSVAVMLCRKADQNKEWWLANTPQMVQKAAEFQKMCGIEIDPDRIKQTERESK